MSLKASEKVERDYLMGVFVIGDRCSDCLRTVSHPLDVEPLCDRCAQKRERKKQALERQRLVLERQGRLSIWDGPGGELAVVDDEGKLSDVTES